MTTFLALSAVALAAPPDAASIEVTYTVTYDLPPFADQVCGVTGICDCTVTWKGTGTRTATSADAVTFRGSYTKASGGCNESLQLWAPADGAAYHTVRFASDGRTLTEWIAHARADATTRITSGTKAAGQVWLAQMSATPGPSGAYQHEERDSGDAGGIQISSKHALTVRLK